MWPHGVIWIKIDPEVPNHVGRRDVVGDNSERSLMQLAETATSARLEELSFFVFSCSLFERMQATSSMRSDMSFWSCSDADGEQQPCICVSSAYRRGQERDSQSVTVGWPCTTGKVSDPGPTTVVDRTHDLSLSRYCGSGSNTLASVDKVRLKPLNTTQNAMQHWHWVGLPVACHRYRSAK